MKFLDGVKKLFYKFFGKVVKNIITKDEEFKLLSDNTVLQLNLFNINYHSAKPVHSPDCSAEITSKEKDNISNEGKSTDLYKGDHPSIVLGLNDLGYKYSNLGDDKKALEYYKQALAMSQNLYEGDHPDIALSLNNVGDAYVSLGDAKEAL